MPTKRNPTPTARTAPPGPSATKRTHAKALLTLATGSLCDALKGFSKAMRAADIANSFYDSRPDVAAYFARGSLKEAKKAAFWLDYFIKESRLVPRRLRAEAKRQKESER